MDWFDLAELGVDGFYVDPADWSIRPVTDLVDVGSERVEFRCGNKFAKGATMMSAPKYHVQRTPEQAIEQLTGLMKRARPK